MAKLRFSSLAAVALFTAVAISANADTLNGAFGGWTPWQKSGTLVDGSNNVTYGGPYWNVKSGDGATNNIGWCLVGGGGCNMANPPGNLNFFANGNSAIDNMWFTTGGSTVTVSLNGVFTSQTSPGSGIDYFGYYTVDPTTHMVTGATPLLNAGNSIPTSSTFMVGPNTSYGFYLENVQGQGSSNETRYWFYMDSTQDQASNGTTPLAFQHFSIFDGGSSLYVGVEDGFGIPDGDYNDMIVQVTTASAPEPASTALVAIGLLAFAIPFRGKLLSSTR